MSYKWYKNFITGFDQQLGKYGLKNVQNLVADLQDVLIGIKLAFN